MKRLASPARVGTTSGCSAWAALASILLLAGTAQAAPTESAPIQRPSGAEAPADDAAAKTAAPDAEAPSGEPGGQDGPPADVASPEAGERGASPDEPPAPPAGEDPGGEPTTPDSLSEDPDSGSAPSPDPSVGADPAPATTPIDASLLEGEEDAPTPAKPRGSLRTQVEDDAARDAAVRAAYDSLYRPSDNPGRLNLGVRALFANAGGNEKVGGRMGGIQADVGQAWNHFGYAATVSVWGGAVHLRDRVAEMNSLIGVGPTVGLGRLALVGRGFLDLRVGYDFFYGVVNQQRSDATIVAPQSDGDVALEQAENLLPHGPRAQLNLGLLGSDTYRKYFHGFGVSMGYQGLVGSLRGELPFTHMLTIGFSYWMG